MRDNLRQRQVEHNRKRRSLVYLTFGILIFIYLTLTVTIGENGLLRYMELKSKRNVLFAKTRTIEKQYGEVKEQVEALKKEPERVEGLARKYGFTKEGELVYKFEDQQ